MMGSFTALLLLHLSAAPLPYDATQIALDKGAELIAIERPIPQWVTYRIGLLAGSELDPPGKSGLARVAALLLVQQLRETPQLGTVVTIETGLTSTLISGGVSSAAFDEAMQRILKVLAAPRINEELFSVAVNRAVAERGSLRDNDRALAALELRRRLFGDHPAGRDPRGETEDLAKLTEKDIRSFFRHVGAARLIIGVAGDIGPQIAQRANKWLGSVPSGKGGKKKVTKKPPKPHGLRIIVIDKPKRHNAQIFMGQILQSKRAASATEVDRSALLAANAVLGGSLSGRLTESLHTEVGSGNVAFSYLPVSRDHPSLSIWLQTRPKHVPKAIGRVLKTLKQITDAGLSGGEADFGRSYAAARARLALKDPRTALDTFIWGRLVGVPTRETADRPRAIEGLETKRVAQSLRVLTPDDLVIVVVTSVTTTLQAELVQIPGVRDVSVVGYDDR